MDCCVLGKAGANLRVRRPEQGFSLLVSRESSAEGMAYASRSIDGAHNTILGPISLRSFAGCASWKKRVLHSPPSFTCCVRYVLCGSGHMSTN